MSRFVSYGIDGIEQTVRLKHILKTHCCGTRLLIKRRPGPMATSTFCLDQDCSVVSVNARRCARTRKFQVAASPTSVLAVVRRHTIRTLPGCVLFAFVTPALARCYCCWRCYIFGSGETCISGSVKQRAMLGGTISAVFASTGGTSMFCIASERTVGP